MSLCGKTQRQIETWFRLRRNQDRPCQTKKFGEAAWRFFFYLVAFVAGLACLIDRPWFWDRRECWRQYPEQPMERAHYWYYMLELSFYNSLLLRIFVDIKRKVRASTFHLFILLTQLFPPQFTTHNTCPLDKYVSEGEEHILHLMACTNFTSASSTNYT
uniref:ceramide synthase 2-like n=1 Tax=Monopterus albus TaxID=43700 RepID=UPI0009B2FEF1|nr:ceramide synthase 2-like [Monopterus albus]